MANEGKIVQQEMRVHYTNLERPDCSLQGVFFSQLDFEKIKNYRSMDFVVLSGQERVFQPVNMIYIAGDRDFNVLLNDTVAINNGRLFSYINPTSSFKITIRPCQSADCTVNFHIFYAEIDNS